ncbi:MAG: hypothetical protein RSC44_05450, partial [Clostridia bacterium]
WSGIPQTEYNGFSVNDKAIQYTATVWGNSSVTNLTKETWDKFVDRIFASITSGGATNSVTVTSPYAAGQQFKADIVFRGKDAKLYTATVKSKAGENFIIKEVSHQFEITKKALTVGTTIWSSDGSGTAYNKSYTYNTNHQGLTSVKFIGLVGDDRNKNISSYISCTDTSTTKPNEMKIEYPTSGEYTIGGTANAGSYGISFAMN